MAKQKRNRQPSQQPAEALLESVGEKFVPNERRNLAALDSAHQVVFGELNGEQVSVKPFRSKSGLKKAQNELSVTRTAFDKGIKTPEPLKVVEFKRQKVALMIAKYVPNLIGAHTLSYETDPESSKGIAIASAAGDIARTIGHIHERKITHGDGQLKNFSFSAQDALSGKEHQPYTHDFESGNDRSYKQVATPDFVSDAQFDMQKLAHSLGSRQFGGQDKEAAHDVMREEVLGEYMQTGAVHMMGALATSKLVDRTMSSFEAGRQNKALEDPSVNIQQAA